MCDEPKDLPFRIPLDLPFVVDDAVERFLHGGRVERCGPSAAAEQLVSWGVGFLWSSWSALMAWG